MRVPITFHTVAITQTDLHVSYNIYQEQFHERWCYLVKEAEFFNFHL